MKINLLAISVLVSLGTGLTTVAPASLAAAPALPNCFDSNYDKEKGLFTLKNVAAKQVNQQCLLTVGPRGSATSSSRLAAGRYQVALSNGGGGGAGGTLQGATPGGGGGGGGAGAKEQQAVIDLAPGNYRLTIGAGGAGGTACMLSPSKFDGGPGWLGAPSNIVQMANGKVIMGAAGAEAFKALTRAQNDRLSPVGKADGRGGSGPGQTTGGRGGSETAKGVEVNPTAGASAVAAGRQTKGGAAGTDTDDKSRSGGGGGGGGSKAASGGSGGGETTTAMVTSGGKPGTTQPVEIQPTKGNLGSGGGGGEGSSVKCEAGAPGGNGFISFRAI